MKDSEFIELLNLYLDHEISTADAARLESEVQTNLTRRRIYQQYCRMQKACKLVAADFQNESEVAAAGDKKVVAFSQGSVSPANDQRRRISGAIYTWGTFAAVAACVAIVFTARTRQEVSTLATMPTSSPAIVQAPTPTVKPRTAVAVETPTSRALAQRSQATLFANPLLLTGNTQAQALQAAAERDAQNQLAWLETVHLAPVQQQPRIQPQDSLHFAATLESEGRPLGNRAVRQQEAADESVSFQFRK